MQFNAQNAVLNTVSVPPLCAVGRGEIRECPCIPVVALRVGVIALRYDHMRAVLLYLRGGSARVRVEDLSGPAGDIAVAFEVVW